MSTDAPARRKFTIRLRPALTLILVVVVAIWTGFQVNSARRQVRAARAIRDYGGFVYYDFEVVNGKVVPGREPWAPRWLRNQLGDDYFATVTQVNLQFGISGGRQVATQRNDPGIMPVLRDLPGLTWLLLYEGQVTDDSLAEIQDLGALQELHLVHASELTDAGLATIAGLRNLRILYIDAPDNRNLTDAGLERLARLDGLQQLYLWLAPGTVGDAGLAHVSRMTGLGQLTVFNGNITDVGLGHLSRLANLNELHLPFGEYHFTEPGMAVLKRLTNLVVLDLQGENVPGRGLDHLASLPHLKQLWLALKLPLVDNALDVQEGVARLVEANPSLAVR